MKTRQSRAGPAGPRPAGDRRWTRPPPCPRPGGRGPGRRVV